MKRFSLNLLLALVVVGLLVACGGGQTGESPPTSPVETATPAETATPTPAADRGDVPAGEGAAELPPVEAQVLEETAGAQGVAFAVPFEARPDGFSFRNYGPDYPQGDFTVDEVRELFGDGVCSRIDEDTDSCIPLAETQQWIDDRNADMRAGHCIGFTVTSFRFAEGDLRPADFSPTADTPYEIEQRVPIMRAIALNGSLYWVKSVWSSEVAGAPRDIIDGLITAIVTGVIVMTLYSLPLKFFGLTGVLEKPPLVFLAVIPVAVVAITLGILGIVLGVRLLKLPAGNTSYYRVYAWLSIVAGAFFVTFFLSPLGMLVDTAANIVLAMLFLRPDPEDPEPEFV